MNASSLDRKLANALQPLVEIGAVVRVAPFVNTLPLGLHYFVAHGDKGPREGQIALADWNRMIVDTDEQLTGVYVFYGTKQISDELISSTSSVEFSGHYDSLPITRYRQRLVFCRRSKAIEAVARSVDFKFGSRFFEAVAERRLRLNAYTDIVAQAERLIDVTVPPGLGRPTLRCFGKWPDRALTDRKDVHLYIYGAPCTAYMERAEESFVGLEVEDSVLASAPEYETHIIWHVPGGSDWTGLIRKCMLSYHRTLFEGVSGASDIEFAAMAHTCNDTLAERHPSFPAEIFYKPRAFRLCLRDHHADPKR